MMSGKMTALVTGASGAIGYAIARELAAMGHKVALGYAKNKAAAEAHAEEIAREIRRALTRRRRACASSSANRRYL